MCPSCAAAADCGTGKASAALPGTRGTCRTTTHGAVPLPTVPLPTVPPPTVPLPTPDTPVPRNAERGLKAPGRARQSSAVWTAFAGISFITTAFARTSLVRTASIRTSGVWTSKLMSFTLGTSSQERRQLAHGHVGSLRNAPGKGQQFFELRFSKNRRGRTDQALLHHGHHELAVGGEDLTARQAPGAVGHRRLLGV